MINKNRMSALSLAVVSALSASVITYSAQAEEASFEVISITSSLPQATDLIPGSADIITAAEMETKRPFSVKELLENIAGVNVVAEDVFSTHLNIGLRGLNPRRSSRTLLLEDGVPLYLAPYGDPSAHYSPVLDNVSRIEVRKGSGQILFGPQTIGGSINFVTTPVALGEYGGNVRLEAGNNSFTNVSGRVNLAGDDAGIAITGLTKSGDGVRDNHELGIDELGIKGLWRINEQHQLRAKFSHFEEDSNVSETGLSLAEYQDNPLQAPTGNIDRFVQERETVQFVHDYTHSDSASVSSQFYHVDNFRASFRQINGPGENIELCPGDNNLADVAGLEEELAPTAENSAICGGRWRPRYFTYWGAESRVNLTHNFSDIPTNTTFGVRYHEEDIERNQFRGYDARFQSLGFAKTYANVDEDDGRAGWHNELIETEVEAVSLYWQSTLVFDEWSVSPGLRLEDVSVMTDYMRTEGAAPTNPEKRHTNDFTEVLPGLGVTYNGIDDMVIFAGVHKGFAPARPSREVDAEEPDASFLATDPEQSWNFEFGLRSAQIKGLQLDATLFYTDFDDIVIQTEAGRFINAGTSQQAGLELSWNLNLGERFAMPHNIYISGNYTNLFTAKFTNSQIVYDEEGEDILETASFQDGNRLPYAPRQMLNANIGFESPDGRYDLRLGVSYVSEQYVDAANTTVLSENGMEGKMPSYSLVSLSANYRYSDALTVYLSGQNITDKEYLASRVDGMVAGRGQQWNVGVNYAF